MESSPTLSLTVAKGALPPSTLFRAAPGGSATAKTHGETSSTYAEIFSNWPQPGMTEKPSFIERPNS
jgi:hypothetical protein